MNISIVLFMAVTTVIALGFLIALFLIRRYYAKEFEDLKGYRRFRFMQLNLRIGDRVHLIDCKPLYQGRIGYVVDENKDGKLLIRFDGLTSPLWCDRNNLVKTNRY